MIKKNAKKKARGVLEVNNPEAAAKYFEIVNDTDRMELENARISLESNVQDAGYSAEDHEREAENYRENEASYRRELGEVTENIAALPPSKHTRTPEAVQKDLERVAALPWVEKVSLEGSSLRVLTRPDSLKTNFSVRLDSGGRLEDCEPYPVALPAYDIELTLESTRTLSNNAFFKIRLRDPEDASHFIAPGFNHEIHAHYASRHVYAVGEWSTVCMGEYESDVTRAFRKSFFDGFSAVAIFLQTARAESAHVRDKYRWAIYLGKPEYNTLFVDPKWKEKQEAEKKKREELEETRRMSREAARLDVAFSSGPITISSRQP